MKPTRILSLLVLPLIVLSLVTSTLPAKMTFGQLVKEGDASKAAFAKAFQESAWETMETIMDKVRNLEPRDEEWVQRYLFLYETLENLVMPGDSKLDKTWLQVYSKLDLWDEAFPDSVTVPVMKIRFWVDFAWKARGSGWANTVTEDGWKKFRERLGKAQKIFQEGTANASPYPCPLFYYVSAPMAMGQSWEYAETDRLIVQPVLENYPAFWPVYRAVALSWEPRWGGPDAGSFKFYHTLLDRMGGDLAFKTYAHLILLAKLDDPQGFRKDVVDWEAYYKGVRVLLDGEWFLKSLLHGIFLLANGQGEFREIVRIFREKFPDTLDAFYQANPFGHSVSQWEQVGSKGLKLRRYFLPQGNTNPINSIQWHPSLDVFAIACSYDGIRILSPDSEKVLQHFGFKEERSAWEAAFSHDGQFLAVASSWEDQNQNFPETLLNVYNASGEGLVDGMEKQIKLKPQLSKGLVFSPDSKRLFLGVATQNPKKPQRVRQMGLEFIDWQQKGAKAKPLKPRAGALFELQLTPDQKYIQCAMQDVQKFPLGNPKSKGVNETPGMRKTSYTISSRYLPGGNYLAVLSPDPKRNLKTLRLHIFDTNTRKELTMSHLDLGGEMYEHTLDAWYDKDMRMWLFAVVGDSCPSLRLWGTDDLRNKAPELVSVHLEDGQEFRSLAYRHAEEGKPGILVSGTRNGMLAVWETNEDPQMIAE